MPDDNKSLVDTKVETIAGHGFSQEYVKELREEAGSWRTKFREAEDKVRTLQASMNESITKTKIESEIKRRGLKIDPSFIKLDKDGDASKAIDSFLDAYPQFNNETPVVKQVVKPITATKQVNMGRYAEVGDIKKDPIARSKLRDQYKVMLGLGVK